MSTRLRKTWKPQVFKRELYSEILDHMFTIPVTARTLDLIDAAYGFDYYILKVRENYSGSTRTFSYCVFHVSLTNDWL